MDEFLTANEALLAEETSWQAPQSLLINRRTAENKSVCIDSQDRHRYDLQYVSRTANALRH